MKLATLAVRLESFGVPFREALLLAGQAGADAVTFDAVGELAPGRLSQTGQREIRLLLATRNLRLAAIGFPTRRGYDTLERLEERRNATAAALKMAFDLGTNLVINQLGQIPDDLDTVEGQAMFDTLRQLSHEGDRVGARLCVRTGGVDPTKLTEFLGGIDEGGLLVHVEPATLMVRGFAVVDALIELRERVGSVQAKDAMRSLQHPAGFRELPVGRGEVDWKSIMGAMADIDFRGPVILEQEIGDMDQRADDLAAAIKVLKPA